ncbi:hypothetical protein QR680_010663 [Steinernema hermaphroditum]|uniref:C3H1-type domain-containing protein n=1 Tax=Steinernema hermaphroditum TaxID=289476 RepID=A0AA39IQX0_9BILA|nr:hypothetical protein QR680_010663 [Steinernema hermaphroditum]
MMVTVSERKEELRKGVLSSLVCIKEPRVTVSELQKTYQEDFPEEPLSRRLADAGCDSFESFLRALPEIVFTEANGVKYVAIAKNNNLGADHIRKQVLQTKTDTRDEKKTGRYAPRANQPKPKVTRSPKPNFAVPPNFKTKLCTRFRDEGNCYLGARCPFAHGFEELRVASRAGSQYDSEMTSAGYPDVESVAGTTDDMRSLYDAALNDDDFVECTSSGDSHYVGDDAYVDFLVNIMDKYRLVPMINDIPGMLATEFNCDIEEICRVDEIHDFVEELVSRSDGNLILFYRNAMGFLTLPENFNGNKYVTLPVIETDEMLSAVDDMLLNTRIDYDMAPHEKHIDAEKIMQLYRTTEEDNGTSEDQCSIM